jgi:putative thioredoxin
MDDMNGKPFNRGAVDLSALQGPPSNSGAGGSSGGYAIDVTEANFQAEVINRSMSVPVVVYFWSARAQGIDQFTATLEKLSGEYDGRFLLAKADVDANPQLAASLQVQAIPTVVAILRGQALPLFQGAPAESEVKGVLDQLLQAAVANGVAGRAEPVAGGPASDDAEEELDPRFDVAYDAITKGEFDQAEAAYQQVLADNPGNAEATAGLAQVGLLKRTADVDAAAARAEADSNPGDVDAQVLVADIDVAAGRADDAFARLIETVRRTSDDDRDRARARLIELFNIVGPTDPRVLKARGKLASALF